MSNGEIAFQLKLRPVKVRKAFAPTTKVVEDKTVYNRRKTKKEVKDGVTNVDCHTCGYDDVCPKTTPRNCYLYD